MERNVRICYIAVDVVVPHFRGASTHVLEVARHLALRGHKVHVISRRVDQVQSSHEVMDGIDIHRLYRGIVGPLPFSGYQRLETGREKSSNLIDKLYERYLFTIYPLYAGVTASRIIKKHNVDIILERETSFGAGAIASAITKKPMVLEIIGPRYAKISFRRSRKILAYTRSMIPDTVLSERFVLVTAAVNVESFKPNFAEGKSIRKKYGFEDSIVIAYSGTFARWHGIEELIQASVRVLKRFSNVRFFMVGPYFKYAKELGQKFGVSKAYVFTGPVPYVDVPNYLNAADILVAPYNPAKSELRRKYGIGSPLKVFEYMACGKPVITTSVAPIIQVVQHEKTGILIKPGDSSALAEAIIHLIEKPELREIIGKAARKEVEKHYSWKIFAMNLERILKEVVKAA